MSGFGWSWQHVVDALPTLLEGFVTVTLLVTVVSSLIAAVLGLAIAIVLRSAPAPIAAALSFVVSFIRMTPIVVQLMFAYFVLLHLDPLTIGILVFGVHYATYMAEVYRAGIDAVPPGQWEAATALSLPRHRTWLGVVVPQAVRATLPALGNYVISMFKDTPFLIAITVADMVSNALAYGGDHFRYTEVLVTAGAIFLLASYPTSLLIRRLEQRIAFTT